MYFTTNKNSMESLLMAYQGRELATLQDESILSLAWLSRRVVDLIEENISCFKLNNWNIRNRLNKLLIDDERSDSTLLNIRVGRKHIARYSFPKMRDMDKVALLEELKHRIMAHQLDDKFSSFLEKELQRRENRKVQRRHKRNENQSFAQSDSQMY